MDFDLGLRIAELLGDDAASTSLRYDGLVCAEDGSLQHYVQIDAEGQRPPTLMLPPGTRDGAVFPTFLDPISTQLGERAEAHAFVPFRATLFQLARGDALVAPVAAWCALRLLAQLCEDPDRPRLNYVGAGDLGFDGAFDVVARHSGAGVEAPNPFVIGRASDLLLRSPEQLAHGEADETSLVRAVGVLLLSLLRGAHPFSNVPRHHGGTMARRIIEETLQPFVSELSVSDELRAVVGCAVEVERTARFPTLEAFEKALAAAGPIAPTEYAKLSIARALGEPVLDRDSAALAMIIADAALEKRNVLETILSLGSFVLSDATSTVTNETRWSSTCGGGGVVLLGRMFRGSAVPVPISASIIESIEKSDAPMAVLSEAAAAIFAREEAQLPVGLGHSRLRTSRDGRVHLIAWRSSRGD